MGNRKGKGHLEGLGIGRRMDNTEMDFKQIVCMGVDWIYLVWNTGQWRIFMNTAISFCVP
jgi:hypothetical protein